jgi:hypothetical protein
MTTTELQALREKAKAATPGEWFGDERGWVTASIPGDDRSGMERELFALCADGSRADIAFIEAIQPQTVLALLDEVERLRITDMQAAADFDQAIFHATEPLKQQLAAAQAEVERLRAEAADARALIEMAAEALIAARRACAKACDLASMHLDAAMEEPARYTRSAADAKYDHIKQIREVGGTP